MSAPGAVDDTEITREEIPENILKPHSKECNKFFWPFFFCFGLQNLRLLYPWARFGSYAPVPSPRSALQALLPASLRPRNRIVLASKKYHLSFHHARIHLHALKFQLDCFIFMQFSPSASLIPFRCCTTSAPVEGLIRCDLYIRPFSQESGGQELIEKSAI